MYFYYLMKCLICMMPLHCKPFLLLGIQLFHLLKADFFEGIPLLRRHCKINPDETNIVQKYLNCKFLRILMCSAQTLNVYGWRWCAHHQHQKCLYFKRAARKEVAPPDFQKLAFSFRQAFIVVTFPRNFREIKFLNNVSSTVITGVSPP